MKKEMEISISPEGEITIHVKGVKGKKCLDFSKFLEGAMGEVVEREKTSEFYEEEVEQENQSKLHDT
jgi:flagellar hook-basal body complex protein FliE